MMKTRLFFALVVLLIVQVLAVSACTAGNSSELIRPSSTSTPSRPTITLASPVAGVTQLPAAYRDEIPTATPTKPTSPPPSFKVCSPLEEHPISELPEIVSASYAPPKEDREGRHHGVDFSYYQRDGRASILGVGVQAVLAGQVAMALVDHLPYGNVVIIETRRPELPQDLVEQFGLEAQQSLYLLYAHLNQTPLVSQGDQVSACQKIGEVGKSGNAGVPHLHLETRIGPSGQTFDRMRYYDSKATLEEAQNYLTWRISGAFRHFDPFDLLEYFPAP